MTRRWMSCSSDSPSFEKIELMCFSTARSESESATAMALLFLGAVNHRISAIELEDLKIEFKRADIRMSRGILEVYQSHWRAGGEAPKPVRLH